MIRFVSPILAGVLGKAAVEAKANEVAGAGHVLQLSRRSVRSLEAPTFGIDFPSLTVAEPRRRSSCTSAAAAPCGPASQTLSDVFPIRLIAVVLVDRCAERRVRHVRPIVFVKTGGIF